MGWRDDLILRAERLECGVHDTLTKYEAEREKLALFAASQHHLNDKLVQALAHIEDLEFENSQLREELAQLKRSKVVSIK
ncbi:hypothetical protein VCRA2121O391_440023 [Vibrio crassostreae]|nr:hypothetical protein VCRA2113O356_390001 [Vibrio crassostreae]CAK2108562.1 hypothetical protein VCRA2117O378_410031 [Vibrio crassostreae]CAK2365937.1 hypothetical protein VCRA2119O386_410033 [Vibrio crassostreae]CAK2895304.1 hypothetical protein VCRA2117O375_400001 [Vibrio crassostreae]CAK2975867.1 hypothetical protein VCRA2133O403_380032 [Vibrio crassostreae]